MREKYPVGSGHHSMNETELINFFNMGGYAFYVWTSYAVVFLVLLALLISAILQNRKVEKNTRD